MAGRRVMMFVLVVAVLAVLGPFAATGRAFAMGQADPTGTFAATIIDPTGAVIPGAEVTLTNQSVKGAQPVTATSDGAGLLQVSNLPPGDYTIDARAKGFSAAKRAHVTIRAGHVERLTLKLPIEVQEQKVEVNGNELDSSPDSNGSAIVLKGSDLDALPDDPQELQEQLQGIAGADPDAGTQFYVDGFSGGRIPPKSEIKEIRINQNPYSAQYDQMGWGRVEIITKAGTGKWHGNMFLQGNDSSFNSRTRL